MTLVSHAQNYEDIMLWRCLGTIERGFYFDVGAAWPSVDSVTKLFYEHGWTGVNVEPNPALFAELEAERTRDVNLQIALADQESTARISIILGTGLSTLDADIASSHQASGRQVDSVEVEVSTVSLVWDRHVPLGQEVHFLKVDVEGFEESVLRGWRSADHRPWIVLVEATMPMSQDENHHLWEPLLIDADYRFVYADGINRFYLAAEHEELGQEFRYPPNVFDKFVQSSLAHAEQRAAAAEVEVIHTRGLLDAENLLRERLGYLEGTLVERTRASDEAHRTATAEVHRLSGVVERLQLELAVTKAHLELAQSGADQMKALIGATQMELELARSGADQMEDSIAATKTELEESRAAHVQSVAELSTAYLRLDALDAHIRSIYASRSWKAIAPVRRGGHAAVSLVGAPQRLLRRNSSRSSHQDGLVSIESGLTPAIGVTPTDLTAPQAESASTRSVHEQLLAAISLKNNGAGN